MSSPVILGRTKLGWARTGAYLGEQIPGRLSTLPAQGGALSSHIATICSCSLITEEDTWAEISQPDAHLLGNLELKLSSPSALDPGGEWTIRKSHCSHSSHAYLVAQRATHGVPRGQVQMSWERRLSGLLALFHLLVLIYLQGLLHSLVSIWDTPLSLQQMHSLSHSFMLQTVCFLQPVPNYCNR